MGKSLKGKELGQGITQRKDCFSQSKFSAINTTHIATYICNEVFREGNEPENIADYSRTFYDPNHNESLLPCNG